MSMQYVATAILQLVGDGTSTTFTIPPARLNVLGDGSQTNVNPLFAPVAAVVRNTPVPVTSAIIDGNGNLVITFTTAWDAGQMANVAVDLYFDSGTALPSSLPISVSGTVAATQSGTWTVNAVQSGTWTVTASNPSVGATGSAVPSSATYIGIKVGSNLVGPTGFTVGSQTAQSVAIVDGSGNQITSFGGGTQYATGTAVATPTGTVALGFDGANVRAVKTDASGNQIVSITGTPTVSVSGTVTVTGTVAATQSGTWNIGTLTSITNTVTVSGTVTANIGTTNGLALDATLTGGSQKTKLVDSGGVNVATVSAAGALKVDGSAVTQPVSGTVAVSSVGGTVTVSGTVAATQSGTWNIGTLTSITNAVTVAQATAANLNATVTGTVAATQSGTWTVQQGGAPWADNITQIGGSAVVTAATGVLKVGVVGNAGAAFDVSSAQNQASPANMILIGGEFNTTPTTITSGNVSPLQLDASGNLRISGTIGMQDSGTSNTSLATWTSATALNTTAVVLSGSFAYNTAIITLSQGSTITAGAVTFEVSNDNTNWVARSGIDVTNYGNDQSVYTLQANTYKVFKFNIGGFQYFRVRLSTQITGTGSVVIGYGLHSNGMPQLSVQEFKDTGRTHIHLYLDSVAAPAAEALATLNINKGGTVTTGTSYTVSAGKTFRITSINGFTSSNSGTQTIKIRFRSAASVTATSPIYWLTTGISSSSTQAYYTVSFPDGLEIQAGQQVGLSLVSTNANNQVVFSLSGFEY